MEKTNAIFLAALRAALLGEKSDIEDLDPEVWRDLLRLAEIHKVLPMILEAVHSCPSLQGLDTGELALIKRQVRRQVMMQTLRTGEFLELNRSLREAGIKPLVVKGIICRRLYPQPDQRPSGDEDVLVAEDQFRQCRLAMVRFGMEVAGEETPEAYEVPFRKEGSPLRIELHRHLFPPESEAYGHLNRFFEGVFERAVEEEFQGSRVWTLAPSDHLFYLICHAFKHFLHSGFGIRQVCDIILYANEYGPRINWQQVLRNCEAIRADKFAAAIFRIGEKYLTFDPDRAAWPGCWRSLEADEGPMLADLLDGGLYGDASLSRKHSSNITLEAAAARRKGKKARGAMVTSVFPSAEKLAGKYPYLREKTWLLPLAWGQRLWNYSRETRNTEDNSAAAALKIGADRVELMKHYGILR